jgi:protein-tyrosine-phosphatase
MDVRLEPETMAHLARLQVDLQKEFAGIFSPETIARFVDESTEQFSGAKVQAFVPVLVRRFARERLRAYGQGQGIIKKEVPEVLFVCTHNAGRSQMAMALLVKAGEGRVHVRSAGSTPAAEINASVVKAMGEIGIDISQEYAKPLTNEVVSAADYVITMGCGDACPIFPGKTYEDWDVADPAGKTVEQVRPIRDEIARRVEVLIRQIEAEPHSG